MAVPRIYRRGLCEPGRKQGIPFFDSYCYYYYRNYSFKIGEGGGGSS